jgi:hypothetical protein
MPPISVLVCQVELVFGHSVFNLLAPYPEFELIKSSSRSEAELLEEIEACNAEVIILLENSDMACSSIFSKLTSINHNLRIVIINADDNWVHVYQRQDVLLTCPAQLVEVIRQRELPFNPATQISTDLN